MKKLFTLIFFISLSTAFTQIDGTWIIANQAGAIGVGPELGNISWWSNNTGDLTLRACYFDDKYVFDEDGTFENVQDNDSWIEEWQGSDPPSCATPVPPHDGSNAATWSYNAGAGTITLNGVGAYLGLAKVFNGGELASPDDAPDSITYMVAFSGDEDTMTIDISIGTGYWRYIMAKVNTAGLYEQSVTQVKIFPNPASDFINIENAQFFKEVRIYSISGQLVLTTDEVNKSISIEDYPPGIYSLHAEGTDGKHYLSKFIIR